MLTYVHSMPPVVCCGLPLCLQLKGAQVRLAEVQTDPESEVKRKVRILERKLADTEVSGGSYIQCTRTVSEHPTGCGSATDVAQEW